MHTRFTWPVILPAVATLAVTVGAGRLDEPEFTDDFGLERTRYFVPTEGNPYFDLEPGRFLALEGHESGQLHRLEITALDETLRIVFHIDGERKVAQARVIEEREWADGELVEVSRNYFACCPGSKDVFYFGEDVDIYKNGQIIGHDGTWRAGRDDAEPGMIMPTFFLLGARYYQEVAPGVALDRAENMEMDLHVTVPAGTFEDCVAIRETTPLEPDARDIKVYAPGVGLVVSNTLRLVEYR